jgi:hypothetical protein
MMVTSVVMLTLLVVIVVFVALIVVVVVGDISSCDISALLNMVVPLILVAVIVGYWLTVVHVIFTALI